MDQPAGQPRIALALAGLGGEGAALRELVPWARSLGFSTVQIDVSVQGLRPRELDRSARRDIAALLRRHALGFAGLELWIPDAHWRDPAKLDRATAAVTQACEMSAELARLTHDGTAVVSTLIDAGAPSAAIRQLASAAEMCGGVIADHAWPRADRQQMPPSPRPDTSSTARESVEPVPSHASPTAMLGVGIDPAVVLLAGGDPSRAVLSLREPPAAARLSDTGPLGRVLCGPAADAFGSPRGVGPGAGSGKLDRLSYQVALTTKGYLSPLILDVRGLAEPRNAAERFAAAEFARAR